LIELSLRVVKVGGSLFDLPDLSVRLQAWLEQQPSARTLLLGGGGPLVEETRRQHAIKPLDESAAHWLCIEAMNATAQFLAERLGGSTLIETLGSLSDTHEPLVFAPLDWLRNEEPYKSGTRLTKSWDVTSDSIAARLAICIGAGEIVLLKSADPPSRDLQELANVAYVDKFFPKLAAELPPWRVVNLREMSF
jgi:5-(aminomethyl)-3-furanmethanol phosphate kinase